MSKKRTKFYETILVPTDGSAYSIRAAEHAAHLAKICGGRVILLHVLEQPLKDQPLEIHEDTWIEIQDEKLIKERGKNIIKKTKEPFNKAGISVKVKYFIGGHPRQSILDTAEKEKVDLIVMGQRGVGGVKRVLLGSVADGVIRHAPCAVLVVR